MEEKALDYLELEIQEVESPDNESWEPNSNVLQEQYMPLTTKPSISPALDKICLNEKRCDIFG